MSNPSKRIKTNIRHVTTVLSDQTNEKRKMAIKQKVAKQGSNHLLNLNADAMFAIFERLDVMDLPNVSQLSDYMKEIICNTFERKHKNLKLNISDYVTGNLRGKNMSVRDRNRIIRLFETFGSLITELEVNFEYWRHDHNATFIIDSIVEHCTSLKSFNLYSYRVPDNKLSFLRIGRMEQLYCRLEKLCLRDFNDGFWYFLSENAQINFNGCASLVELKLCDCYAFCQPIIRSFFPKLEHFIVKDKKVWKYNDMDAFIMRHPNLKTLSIDCNVNEIPMAAANLPNLEKFGFRSVNNEFPPVNNLTRFRNLKKLTCFAVGEAYYMAQLLEVLPKLANSLEVLDLRHGFGNRNFIQIVNSLKKLKVVRLQDIKINGTSTEDLKDLIRATVIIK